MANVAEMTPQQGESDALTAFLESPTRFLFFTGKGGVGKTSLASASAIALADRGKKVLLVSTDPASNLDEVLGVDLESRARAVPSVEGLFALNIDPSEAARAYREKLVEPHRGTLPESILKSMEEQLSGACTTEIASFDEFSKLLGDPATTEDYDHVVFDTAPTGHTLRLLSLPGAWTGFIKGNTTGNSCLGPLAGLEQQQAVYQGAVDAISDAERATLVLVTRSQRASLEEAVRTSRELATIGVANQRIILNGVFNASGEDPVALAMARRGETAVKAVEEFLGRFPLTRVPLKDHNLVGVEALRALASPVDPSVAVTESEASEIKLPATTAFLRLVDEIAEAGHGVVMTMGKGGVGKTSIAAAIATELAARGCKVHLSTTDPAAHVAAAAGETNDFEVHRIDPQLETDQYVEEVLATAGRDLDAQGRELLEEDLRSPCTEEIAVFRAFAKTIALGKDAFVVLDTAPTGHTLLLLDATEAYHRDVERNSSMLPDEVKQLLPRLRDPAFNRVLLVTLPEATPVHEAVELQEDLRRARIEPYAWIINQSIAKSGTEDLLLSKRATNELPFVQEVAATHARKTVLLPWVLEEPSGPEKLRQFFVD